MTKEPYTTRSGATQYRPVPISEARYRRASEEYDGFCLACGVTVSGGIEPDCRKGTCENCGANKVYGIEELLMMGLVRIK